MCRVWTIVNENKVEENSLVGKIDTLLSIYHQFNAVLLQLNPYYSHLFKNIYIFRRVCMTTSRHGFT